jgi:hypothetical protein
VAWLLVVFATNIVLVAVAALLLARGERRLQLIDTLGGNSA